MEVLFFNVRKLTVRRPYLVFPIPIGGKPSWQEILTFEFMAKSLSAMVSAYLLKLPTLLTFERIKMTLPYLAVNFP
jgi:hypothetical protein